MKSLQALLSITILTAVLFSCNKPDEEVIPMTPIKDPNKVVDLLEGKYENIKNDRHYRIEFSHLRTVTLSGWYKENNEWKSMHMQTFSTTYNEDSKTFKAKNSNGHLNDVYEVIDEDNVYSRVLQITYSRVEKFTETPAR